MKYTCMRSKHLGMLGALDGSLGDPLSDLVHWAVKASLSFKSVTLLYLATLDYWHIMSQWLSMNSRLGNVRVGRWHQYICHLGTVWSHQKEQGIGYVHLVSISKTGQCIVSITWKFVWPSEDISYLKITDQLKQFFFHHSIYNRFHVWKCLSLYH